MRELASTVTEWLTAGTEVVLGRAVSMEGFGGRRSGEALAVTKRESVGELAMGAANQLAIDEARLLLADPSRSVAMISVPVGDQEAAAAGLACGGRANILLQRASTLDKSFWNALIGGEDVALATNLVDGAVWLATLDLSLQSLNSGRTSANSLVSSHLQRMLSKGPLVPQTLTFDGVEGDVFVEAFTAAPHIVVFGIAVLSDAIQRQADLLGWKVSVHSETSVVEAQQVAATLRPVDGLVVLSHDIQASSAVLAAAAKGRTGYLGALGSRHTQSARRAELVDFHDATEQQLARIHGPVGLDLGSRTPEETAVAVVAEMLSVVRQRSGVALVSTSGSING